MRLFGKDKQLSDEALMKRFQQGDQKAFDAIYRRYSKRLLHFMFRLLNHDEPVAQDKLHDVFIKLVEDPKKFDSNRNFKSWIFTVAANECRKHYRTEPTVSLEEDMLLPESNEETVLETMGSERFQQALKRELQHLSYEHRCTFVMRFQEGFTVKEISEIMGCSAGTVKSRTHYSLKILAGKLAKFNPAKTV